MVISGVRGTLTMENLREFNSTISQKQKKNYNERIRESKMDKRLLF